MESEICIAAVVVLYKRNYRQTVAYESLLKNWPYPVLIYDNSPEIQQFQLKDSECYFHNPQNPGVSKAYNHAIEWAKLKDCSHILLLDSDSKFPNSALEFYFAEVKTHSNSIVFPAMFSAKHKISPFYFKWGKTFYGDNIKYGKIELGKILAINSGTIIPLSYFDTSTHFNENLPLDWSDIAFFRSLKNKHPEAQHIQLKVEHGLSEHESQNIEQASFRFSHYVKGIKYVSSNFPEKLIMLFWAKLKALKLSIRFKSFKFIGIFLKSLNA